MAERIRNTWITAPVDKIVRRTDFGFLFWFFLHAFSGLLYLTVLRGAYVDMLPAWIVRMSNVTQIPQRTFYYEQQSFLCFNAKTVSAR